MDEPTSSREAKHVVIEGSINRLSGAADQLVELATRVRDGTTPPTAKPEPEPTPSLQATLDTASKKLEAIRDSIVASIGELEASLF